VRGRVWAFPWIIFVISAGFGGDWRSPAGGGGDHRPTAMRIAQRYQIHSSVDGPDGGHGVSAGEFSPIGYSA